MPGVRTRDRLLVIGAAGLLAFAFTIMVWALANGPPLAIGWTTRSPSPLPATFKTPQNTATQ